MDKQFQHVRSKFFRMYHERKGIRYVKELGTKSYPDGRPNKNCSGTQEKTSNTLTQSQNGLQPYNKIY